VKHHVRLRVNGQSTEVEVAPRELLADVLREHLGLTGTHLACEQGSCGACTVLLDGVAVRSCLLLAVQACGHEITTIEGVGTLTELHPLQRQLSEHHGLQCGFCTPGVVMAALDLLATNPTPSRSEIEHAMAGVLCRCTGYVAIVDAVEATAAELAAGGAAAAAHAGRADGDVSADPEGVVR
jgi:carbon-monoxide dehydrogenase small subunit